MNIIMKNFSCSICGLKLDKDIHSFPPFVANLKDPLYKYGDTSFHSNCLENNEGKKAIELSERSLFHIKPVNRICKIDGNLITDPDDYLFIPLLTSNENEELYKFNFLTFSKKNIKKWPNGNKFIEVADDFIKEGKWLDTSEFKFLNHLIQEVSIGNDSNYGDRSN
ncbi:conserved hypothetical protein [Tenacibaculum litopenaei]